MQSAPITYSLRSVNKIRNDKIFMFLDIVIVITGFSISVLAYLICHPSLAIFLPI
jgi:hypothetical protein